MTMKAPIITLLLTILASATLGQIYAATLTSNIIYIVDSGGYACDLTSLDKDLTIGPAPGAPSLPLPIRPIGSFRFRSIPAGRTITMRSLSFSRDASGSAIIAIESGTNLQLQHSRYQSPLGDTLVSVQDSRLLVQNLTIAAGSCPSIGCISVSGPTSNVSIIDSSFQSIQSGVVMVLGRGAAVELLRTNFQSFTRFALALNATSGALRVVDTTFSLFPATSIEACALDTAYHLDLTILRSTFASMGSSTAIPTSIVKISAARTVDISNCTFRDSYSRAVVLNDIASSIAIRQSSFLKISASIIGKSIIGITGAQGSLLIDSCVFARLGFVDALGGALSIEPAETEENCPNLDIIISNSEFMNNTAMYGGAIFAQGMSSMSILNSVFRFNSASLQGGGVRISGLGKCNPTLKISGSEFEGHEIEQRPPPLPIPNDVFDKKKKKRFNLPGVRVQDFDVLVGEVAGAAVSIDGPFADVSVSSSRFTNNIVATLSGWAEGGAIRIKSTVASGKISLSDNLFQRNSAFGSDLLDTQVTTATGGALSVIGSNLNVELLRNTFVSNAASVTDGIAAAEISFGGAVFIQAFDSATWSKAIIRDCVFRDNSAVVAGAVVLQQVSTQISNVSFSLNRARYLAGALAIVRSKLVEKFDVDDVSLSTVTFDTSSIVLPLSSSTRTPTCYLPGLLPQESFRIDCVGCSVDGSSASAPYGNHLAVFGGSPFMFTGPDARDVPILPSYSGLLSMSGDAPVESTRSLNGAVAVLSDTLDSVIVTFFSWYNTSLSCGEVFDSSTLNLVGLSADYRCEWTSNSQIVLTASSLPWPMDLSFRPIPSLSSADGVLLPGPFRVGLPLSPNLPEVETSATSAIAACENLLLSGKFSVVGIFPYQARWSVLSAVGAPNVAAYINSNSGQSNLLIADALWGVSATPRTLIVAYTVSSAVVSVTKNITIIREADPKPTISVEGPSRRRHYASVELQINARVDVPACLSSRNLSLSRQWSLVPGRSLAKPVVFGQGLALFLPAAAMAPGGDYVFDFSASVPEVAGLSVTQQVRVSALFTPMMAYSSGDGGLLSQNSSLSFEVTVVDPDSSTSNTLYLWDVACGTKGVPPMLPTEPLLFVSAKLQLPFSSYRCEDDSSCLSLPLGRSRAQTVASRALAERNYTVYAYTARDERSLVTPFRIDIRNIAPTVAVRLIPQWISPKPLHYERLAVSATVNGLSRLDSSLYTIRWAVLRSGVNVLSSASVTTPLDSKTLYIAFRPNTFASGEHYSLELTVLDKASGDIVGRNWLEMPMNDAPTGGSITVLPLSVAQFDTVSISANGWTDEDDPVRYSYSLVIDDINGDEIVLSDLVDVRSTSVPMILSGSFLLRARVMDIMGSATIVDTSIQVSPASSQPLQNEALLLLQDALRMGDLRRASGYVVLLLREANAAQDAALSLRQAIATSLGQYSAQAPLSSTNAVFLLRACDLLSSVPAGVDSIVRNAIVDIIVKVVDFAFENPTFGSSSSRLFSSRSSEGQRSLAVFVKSLSSAMFALRNSTLDPTRRVALQKSVEKVPLIMSRFSLTDEERSSASSLYVNMMSFVTCGSEAFNITMASGLVLLSPTQTLTCNNDGIQFGVSIWANGTFPTQPITNVSGVLTIIPTTVISISIVPNGQQSVSYNVTAVFPDGQSPAGIGGSVSGCARFDGSQWTTAGCTARVGSTPVDPVVCQCDQPISAVTTSTPATSSAGKVSLTLVFGDFPIVSNPLPSSPSSPEITTPSAATAGGSFENATVGGLSVIAIASIASVGGVVLIAATIAVSFFIYRRKNTASAVRRVRTLMRNSVVPK